MTIDLIGYVLHRFRHSDVATVKLARCIRVTGGGGYSHIWARQICAAR